MPALSVIEPGTANQHRFGAGFYRHKTTREESRLEFDHPHQSGELVTDAPPVAGSHQFGFCL
ncbi:hypothetical protein AB833_10815 [Chromatiales bacterium (ex Bugula neritina AB1)]|nr:hypothetical protein AB833_10815 [Chromatiales bacterium (ex Bugula neritina AB1)]